MIKMLMGGALICTAALTTKPLPPPERTGTWKTYCAGSATTCEVVRTLRLPSDPPLTLRVGFVRHADGFRMWLRTPKLTDPTVRMTFDTGVTVKLPEPDCGEDSCRIGLNIDADQARLVKAARVATFELMLSVGSVSWEVELHDLAGALDNLP